MLKRMLHPSPDQVRLTGLAAMVGGALGVLVSLWGAKNRVPPANPHLSGGVRAVTFEADGFTIELDILGDGAHRTLVGQLVPVGIAEIERQFWCPVGTSECRGSDGRGGLR